MARLLLLCFFILASFSSAALAQGGGQTALDDAVGLYFDCDGQMDCAVDVVPGIYHFFIVMTDLTSDGISGFELKLQPEGNVTYFNLSFPGDYINVGTRENEMILGFGQPIMATDGCLVAGELDVYLADELAANFFIEPIYFASIVGSPCYLDAYDTQLIKPLIQSSGEEEEPVLMINDGHCGPVATQPRTWDGVKSLYR